MITHVKINAGLDKEDEKNCTDIFRDIMHLKHELNTLANNAAATLTIVITRRMTIGLKDKKRGLRIKGINMLSSTKAKFIPRMRFCVEL